MLHHSGKRLAFFEHFDCHMSCLSPTAEVAVLMHRAETTAYSVWTSRQFFHEALSQLCRSNAQPLIALLPIQLRRALGRFTPGGYRFVFPQQPQRIGSLGPFTITFQRIAQPQGHIQRLGGIRIA